MSFGQRAGEPYLPVASLDKLAATRRVPRVFRLLWCTNDLDWVAIELLAGATCPVVSWIFMFQRHMRVRLV